MGSTLEGWIEAAKNRPVQQRDAEGVGQKRGEDSGREHPKKKKRAPVFYIYHVYNFSTVLLIYILSIS